MARVLIVFFTLALFACGSDTPVPEYPFPRQAPLEETDLAQYVVEDDVGDEEEDEEWDDGLSDEDLQMGSDGDTSDAAEDAETAEEAEEDDG